MKFGGTSVEDAAAIDRLIQIVRSRLPAQPLVVVSALAGVTNQLLEAGTAAAASRLGSALATARDLYIRHEQLAAEVLSRPTVCLDRDLRVEFRKLESLLHDLAESHQLTPQVQDRLLGFGECLSSKLVNAALRDAGVDSAHVDARSCIVTDARHGQATPLWDLTGERLEECVAPLLRSGQIPVMGGYIAATDAGVPTTLGRGGSDFSAAIVGAALHASRIEIWTDVDGIMTTDPKLHPDAKVIRKISFNEAAEMAHKGAKVLHPATLAPVIRENIPLYVLNSRRPESEGTEIVSRAGMTGAARAITAKRGIAAVEIDAPQGVDSEVLRAICSVFDQHSCPVDVITTSSGHASLLVGSTVALPQIAAALEGIARVRWENHKALVCLVGEGIGRQPDVASRAFAAVSDMKVRVSCQGASECSISFLVDESRVEESVQRLHQIFFPPQESPADWGGDSSAFCQARQPDPNIALRPEFSAGSSLAR
jgi:aspartate kinase